MPIDVGYRNLLKFPMLGTDYNQLGSGIYIGRPGVIIFSPMGFYSPRNKALCIPSFQGTLAAAPDVSLCDPLSDASPVLQGGVSRS